MTFLIHRLVGERTLLRTVEGETLTIGRGAAADVRLDDAAVALEHAEIRREGKDWVLQDRGSVTGTYRNGRQVERETLSGDDTVEIGGYRLRFQVTHPDDPLFVHLSSVEASELAAPSEAPATPSPSAVARDGGGAALAVRPARSSPPPEAVDYAAAYSLARPGWTKGALTVALTIVALLTLAALAVGTHRPMMPGISSAHALIVAGGKAYPAAAEAGAPAGAFLSSEARRIATRGCAACHRPWRGPAAVEDGCVACHGDQGEPHAPDLGPAWASSAASSAACASCHPEHRGQDLVRLTVAADCTGCHGELSAVAANVTVASSVTSFSRDHPELTVTLPTLLQESGGEVKEARRLSVLEAAGADPGSVDFGHRAHRVQEEAGVGQTLLGPDGPVALVCGECHVVDGDTGRMQPVSFEEHCQSCHRLSFDERLPDRQAPHGTPQEVVDFLLGLYNNRSDTGQDAEVSLQDWRLGLIAGGDRRRLPQGVNRQMADAARTLFRSGCDFCHRVDLDAVPLPVVAPAAIPDRWIPGARFSHLDHRNVACGSCHPDAAASAASADVLMPGIGVCRSCHGDESGGAALAGGTLACAQCHGYHRTEIARAAPPVTTAADPSVWRRPG